MIVADVINCKHGPVFLGMPSFRPKAGKICRSLRWHAQHHYRGAFIVVNQRPEFTARVSKGPFRYDIFSWFRVTLHSMIVDECFLEELGNDRFYRIYRDIYFDSQNFLYFRYLSMNRNFISINITYNINVDRILTFMIYDKVRYGTLFVTNLAINSHLITIRFSISV